MKKSFCLFAFFALYLFACSSTQAQQLTKVWETDTIFKVPESTLYYAPENVVFVSNIDGKSNEKDGQGFISKISADGKVLLMNWAMGLNAPKGMGIYKTKLYVADVDEIVQINVANGKVDHRYAVEGAVFLNDITVGDDGAVYVSDSRTGKIHRLKKGKISLFLQDKMGVNGLYAHHKDVYFVAKDTLYKMKKGKSTAVVATGLEKSTDGIVMLKSGNLIVSCWSGIVYYINADGTTKELLDLRSIKTNTADIGFNPATNILYIPTFFANKILAYRLDE